MLKQLPEYADANIVRTRDPAVIAKADIVVDVGAVYDPETHRYDHHQREFTGTFDDKHKIRLSSAGLVYKHFGRRVLNALYAGQPEATIELVRTQMQSLVTLESHFHGNTQLTVHFDATGLSKVVQRVYRRH